MEFIDEIKSLSLYTEMIDLSKEKGYSICYTLGPDDMQDLATCIASDNKILITVKPSAQTRKEVYIHELLHVKHHLLGYPNVSLFNEVSLPDVIKDLIVSLVNTVYHTFVYPQMKHLGFNQDEIDEQFVEDTLKNLKMDIPETGQMILAGNLLELSLRRPEVLISHETDFSTVHPDAFSLFMQFKPILQKVIDINNPVIMRDVFCDLFKCLDDYLLQKMGVSCNLNLFTCVDPVFEAEMLDEIASKHAYLIDQSYPYLFLMDKKNHHCFNYLPRKASLEVYNFWIDTQLLRDIVQR